MSELFLLTLIEDSQMNLPTIFNIAIGLIFIYLVLSLLASQIQEILATLLEWRAEQLTRAIENLVLGDTDSASEINNKKTYDLVDNLFRNPLIQNLNQTSKSWAATIPKKLTSWLATIPIVQNFIPQDKESNRNTINPTYIHAETFSSTILSELDIPKVARILTWLNAKRLIHYEIYNKIDKLFERDDKLETNIIEPHYEELKNCVKSSLDDYKMERYGLSSTLIRLRTHIETFKREINIHSEESVGNEQGANQNITTIKDLIKKIIEIIEFIFTNDKNDSDLVNRLKPSLTTVLDLLIHPDSLELAKQAVEYIFTSEGNKHNLNASNIPNLTEFLEVLKLSNISKIKPHEDTRVAQIIEFIFQSSQIESSHGEEFSKSLACLIANDTSKTDKLNAYQNFKVELRKSKAGKADQLYKAFIEVEKHFIPLAYQSFQIELRKSKQEATFKKTQAENDLYESFTYSQQYFSSISYRLPESLRKSLYALALRSRIKASDIEKHLDNFKDEIEVWFDRSMERASGVYKRNARGFAFLIGLVLAVALNADTFYIISRLAKDDALRNSIVSASTQLVQNVQSPNLSPTASPSPTTKSSSPVKLLTSPTPSPSPLPTLTSSQNTIERVKNNVDQSLSDISLPIGWTDNILDEQFQITEPVKYKETSEEKQVREKDKERRKAHFFGHHIHPIVIMIMGWLVTATAMMMGAPFWFDFLGLFINVRNTGSRPAKTNKN